MCQNSIYKRKKKALNLCENTKLVRHILRIICYSLTVRCGEEKKDESTRKETDRTSALLRRKESGRKKIQLDPACALHSGAYLLVLV